MRRIHRSLIAGALLSTGGCGAIIEPGHRGLLFSRVGGLQHEVLGPGYHALGRSGRVDDFDVTYSTRKEHLHTTSGEGLALDLKVAVIYRPIISELYELDTEIGPTYYDEVIGPEFRSAARGVFARHSYQDLHAKNDKIEDEIEVEVRRRVTGKHVEISSVTMEEVLFAPEIEGAIRAKLVGEQEAVRKKTALENDDLREKLTLAHDAEKAKMRAEAQLRDKQQEHAIAEEQAAIDRIKADTDAAVQITKAKAASEETKLMAVAHAEESRADRKTLTPLAVMDHAYEALGKLGGSGTAIMLGDWSHVPQFLFPKMPAFQNPVAADRAQKTLSSFKTVDPFPTVPRSPIKTKSTRAMAHQAANHRASL